MFDTPFLLKISIYTTVTNAVKKNFACGGHSSFLYLNFVQDFIIYLYTTVTNSAKKFGLWRAFVTPAFHFCLNFINYWCAAVTDVVKKISSATGIRSS